MAVAAHWQKSVQFNWIPPPEVRRAVQNGTTVRSAVVPVPGLNENPGFRRSQFIAYLKPADRGALSFTLFAQYLHHSHIAIVSTKHNKTGPDGKRMVQESKFAGNLQ